MIFEIISQNEKKIVYSVTEGIEYLCTLGAMQALEVHETGFNFAMMLLSRGESLILDDKEGKEIKVKRLIS